MLNIPSHGNVIVTETQVFVLVFPVKDVHSDGKSGGALVMSVHTEIERARPRREVGVIGRYGDLFPANAFGEPGRVDDGRVRFTRRDEKVRICKSIAMRLLWRGRQCLDADANVVEVVVAHLVWDAHLKIAVGLAAHGEVSERVTWYDDCPAQELNGLQCIIWRRAWWHVADFLQHVVACVGAIVSVDVVFVVADIDVDRHFCDGRRALG